MKRPFEKYRNPTRPPAAGQRDRGLSHQCLPRLSMSMMNEGVHLHRGRSPGGQCLRVRVRVRRRFSVKLRIYAERRTARVTCLTLSTNPNSLSILSLAGKVCHVINRFVFSIPYKEYEERRRRLAADGRLTSLMSLSLLCCEAQSRHVQAAVIT